MNQKRIDLPHRFKPRHYQKDILEALLVHNIRHFYLVQHRRSGKDKLTLQMLIACAMRRVGYHLYLFPKQNQARKAIWKGAGSDGMRFIEHIPQELIKNKPNNTEMSVELINGSIIQFAGSTNVDTLVGTNPITIAYSEFTLHNSNVRNLLSPILSENGGAEILNCTPRGKGPAYDIFKKALKDDRWCVRYLNVEQTKRDDGTPVISQQEIEEFRRSGMPEEMIQQEFYCSWDSGNVGAYFTQEILEAEVDSRIYSFEVPKNLPVYTFWDIGISDATAIWFLQPDGYKLKFVYYYENTGKGFEHYAQVLATTRERFGFRYIYHFAPHDIRQRQWGATSRSSLAIARECGIDFMVTPNISINDRIQAAKSLFSQCWFHVEHCAQGIECLRHFMRKWNDERRVFDDKPLHDWSSHGSDAFTYFAVNWQQMFTRPDLNQPRKFQNQFLNPDFLKLGNG